MDELLARKTNRLREYDYSMTGYYYVTICTYNREELFGHIENNQMILNKSGRIAKTAWLEIPNHFPNIELDEFIVMPNHIHGIIIINNPVGDGHARPVNKNNNLSVIIGSYKSAVSKEMHQLNNISFHWQRSFYEHVIRTEKSLSNIREYISNNPATWINDNENIINYKRVRHA